MFLEFQPSDLLGIKKQGPKDPVHGFWPDFQVDL
jgi:hypothetical protein